MVNDKMAKYNITEKKKKTSPISYRSVATPKIVEDIAKQIVAKLMVEQRYRDPNYSAKRLAEDIGVDMRHISAVINMRFQQNYPEFVARMRIYQARYLLQERTFDNMTIEDISTHVGFSTRQSFYAAFYKLCGTTPREYRLAHGFSPKTEKNTREDRRPNEEG